MISSTTERSKYTGNGSTNVYAYGYRIVASSDLLVTVKNTTTLVETTLTLNTDYTVGSVGQASGSITLVSAGQPWLNAGNLATGYIIVIRRVRPLTQNTSIRNQGTFFAATHEDTFDNQTMVSQQQQDSIDRSVKLPETLISSDFNPTMPTNIASVPPGSILITNPTQDGWDMASPFEGIAWKVVNITFAQLQAAALTDTITLFSLPAGYMLTGIAIKHSIAFSGTSISSLLVDLGVSGAADKYISQFDILQAPADAASDFDMANDIQSWASATNIQLKATAVGANLSALSAGYLSVAYLIQKVGLT